MGYELHITRRNSWSDKGKDIPADEWLAYVRSDPDLCLRPEHGAYFAEWSGPSELECPWLDWSDGQIHSKNPDSKLIDKMVSIARHFDAAVLGDDDESYVGGDQAPRPSKLSFSERVVNLFARYRRQRAPEVEHTPLPFDVGDTVHDLWGNEHTVIRIDLQALHGAGMIWTRRRDGTELGHMMTEHHLEPTTTKGTS